MENQVRENNEFSSEHVYFEITWGYPGENIPSMCMCGCGQSLRIKSRFIVDATDMNEISPLMSYSLQKAFSRSSHPTVKRLIQEIFKLSTDKKNTGGGELD